MRTNDDEGVMAMMFQDGESLYKQISAEAMKHLEACGADAAAVMAGIHILIDRRGWAVAVPLGDVLEEFR